MATAPKVHLGLVRTFDLLETLIDDVNRVMELLMEDQESQFLRRMVVRNAMSFVEGVLQILKYEIKRAYRLGSPDYQLNNKQREIIYEETLLEDGTTVQIFVPFEQNFLKVFKIANKVIQEVNTPFVISQEAKQLLMNAKNTRNRLTHPRNYYDVEIKDIEITWMLQLFELTRIFFRIVITSKKFKAAFNDANVSMEDIQQTIFAANLL